MVYNIYKQQIFAAERFTVKKLMTEVDILKRFLAFFCVLSFALSAVAFGTTFTRTVQCVNQNDYVKSPLSNEKDNDDHRIYVYYNAQGCSNSYTNHFRGYAYDEEGGILCGSKWVVPDQLIPIEGGGFTEWYRYYLTMRGNTKYHEYEGLSTVVLSGYFQVN